MQLAQITVRRTDNGTDCTMHVRADRLEAFKELRNDRKLLAALPHIWQSMGEGISGMAAIGLSTIFSDIPMKFPVADLLKFLQSQGNVTGLDEVEKRLELMGMRFHGIDCEGNDVDG